MSNFSLANDKRDNTHITQKLISNNIKSGIFTPIISNPGSAWGNILTSQASYQLIDKICSVTMSITANGTISDDINLILTSTLPFPAILGTGTGLCNSSNINYASPTNSAYGNGNVEVSNNNAFLTLSDVNGTRDGISSDVHYISASFQYQIFLI